MGANARRTWHRGPASLALLTSLIVLSSFFIIAGAQVASAAQCGQVNNTPACSLAFRFEDPAKSGIYNPPAPGFSSPHEAAVGEGITSSDLDPSAAPVTVEVEDSGGHRDTNYGGQITVSLVGSGGVLSGKGFGQLGARQPCPCPVTAVKGAASFDLSIDTKGYFQLKATASPSTNFTLGTPDAPLTSDTFRIQADRCASGETCTDSFQNTSGQTLMEASLANDGTGVVALSVGIDALTSCSTSTFTDPWFHAPAETTVDEVRATGSGTKVAVLRIEKAFRLIVPDNGASSYRGCVTAPIQFTTWDGSKLIFNSETGEYTGLVPDCTKAITTFCRSFTKSNKAGDVLEGITLPSGSVQGDPKVH